MQTKCLSSLRHNRLYFVSPQRSFSDTLASSEIQLKTKLTGMTQKFQQNAAQKPSEQSQIQLKILKNRLINRGAWLGSGAIAIGLILMANPLRAQLPSNSDDPNNAPDRQPTMALILENRTKDAFIRRFVIRERRNRPGTDLLANSIGIYPNEARLMTGNYPRRLLSCVEVVPVGGGEPVRHIDMGRVQVAGNRIRFSIEGNWKESPFASGPCP